MNFQIRPATLQDLPDLLRLATSLSAQGFLTLPSEKEELGKLVALSERSFSGRIDHRDEGRYLFVLTDGKKVCGSSLIIARHGTGVSPHLFFRIDPQKRTLRLQAETTGRTELGGLILDPAFRGHPEKLGKRLSYARLLYIMSHPDRFLPDLLAELLPPFGPGGRSALWEALGRKFTGLDYREADERARRDKSFVTNYFPDSEIPIDSLPREAQEAIGQVGPETKPVAKILEEVGFRYLNEVDPFDGGPHFGARISEIQLKRLEIPA